MPNSAKKISLLVVLLIKLSSIIHAQQITGNVFIDRDGLVNNNISTSVGIPNPTVSGSLLFVNLLNNSGQSVASAQVTSTGDFLFNNIPNGAYVAQLTINASNGTYVAPVAAPNTTLASDWVNTGEFIGNGVGNDGNVNGKSASITISSASVINNVNFGIERLPETMNTRAFINSPTSGTFTTLNLPNIYGPENNNNIWSSNLFIGNDEEDQPITGSLSGKTIRIDSLLSAYGYFSIAGFADLFYNGNMVYAGQIITSYNPSLLQVRLLGYFAGSGIPVRFYYSFIDAAGFADPTPAFYSIHYPVAGGPLPIVLSDFTVVKNNCNALISWKTSSEINANKFEVEYSTNTNTTVKTLGSIVAYGNSSSARSYQFSFEMEAGTVYNLNLKMINKDGTFSYSEIRRLSCIDANNEIKIAPNPVLNVFSVNGMKKGKNSISIYNNDGKLVSSFNAINNKNIDISRLPSGVYVLKILNENGANAVERLVKY
jgi:hypothetical protein